MNDPNWNEATLKPKKCRFRAPPAIQLLPERNDPISFYNLLVTNEIFDWMVDRTNVHAEEVLQRPLGRRGRFRKWVPTDRKEMKHFLGIMLYMGVVSNPTIRDYWSSSPFFNNPFVKGILTRDRFQLLLRMWSFDSADAQPNDRLSKLRVILNKLNANFKAQKRMDKKCVIDESMVGFRGRLSFRQYKPGKSHKYGVKLFKLTNTKGYSFTVRIYAGKTHDAHVSTDDLVMSMMAPYLNRGRILVVDNFYTSVNLAKRLLQKRTHLLGTVRKNRKYLPSLKEITLEKGEMVALSNKEKITHLSWRDKRDVRMLSTAYPINMKPISRHRGRNRPPEMIFKPNVVLEYNECKQGIDLSDQLSSYQSTVQKSVRWYHKVV